MSEGLRDTSPRAEEVPDGFDEFLAEKGMPEAMGRDARRIAQLRMMRGRAPWTEREWDEWALKA